MFKAAPEQYDLIVTDLTMPQMNGIDLAAKIKEIRPDIPVALHTGLAAEISKERLDQAGIKHIIRKPALEEEFAPALRRLLSKESESE
jgi:CheY-like chemotaxis protein